MPNVVWHLKVQVLCRGRALTIYAVPWVCQHQGCDFDKKKQEKGYVFLTKMQEKRVCFVAENELLNDNSRTFLALRAISQHFYSEKGTFWQNL